LFVKPYSLNNKIWGIIMKLYLIIFVLTVLVNNMVLSQESPLIRIEGIKEEEEIPEPIIEQLGIACSEDIQIFSSNNDQSEESIAINPIDLNNVFIGANVKIWSEFRFKQGFYYSFDEGFNWSGSDELPGTGNLTTDPAVVFDADGNLYFNYLENISENWSCRVKKSTDGGVTWLTAKIIQQAGSPDKNHITSDITSSPYKNYVYVAFSDMTDGLETKPIKFSRSTNGGNTFSPSQIISGDYSGMFAQGVNLAVGPNGELYAVWAINDNWSGEICTPPYDFDSDGIGFNKSLDGGANWSNASRIFNIQGSRDWWCDKNPQGYIYRIRMNDFPVIAVDRSGGRWNGTIYLVWGAKGSGGDRTDIHFSKSTNGGSNWSTPIKINNDATTNDQWFPWISVDPYGLITIIFYDSRNDPNNQLTEVWVAQSSDGGESFDNFRISDIAFTPYPIRGTSTGYMGDYLGITSKAGKTYPCWCDNRALYGRYQVYIDIIDTYISDLLILANQGKSLNINATAYNNGRRLVKDGLGNYHLVLTSGNNIFYRKSTDAGNSWSPTVHLSTDGGQNKFPSIATHGNFLFVTYQQYNGIENNQHKYTIKGKWKQLNDVDWYSMSVSNPIYFTSATDPLPVIVAADNVDNNYSSAQNAPEVMIAFQKNDGIYHSNLFYSIPDDDDPVYNYLQKGPDHIIPNSTARFHNPSLTVNGIGEIMLTCDSDETGISYIRAYLTTGGSWTVYPTEYFHSIFIEDNTKSSVTSDGANKFQISWQGYNYFHGFRSILHKTIFNSIETPISEFANRQYSSLQPSTFGHLDANGGVSIYWYTDDELTIKKVDNYGTGWNYSWNDYIPSIKTNARFVNSLEKDEDFKYAYCWTSADESPYSYNVDIYDLIPGDNLNAPMNMENDTIITFRSAELKNIGLDALLALKIGNFVLLDANSNHYPLDLQQLDTNFIYQNFNDALNTLFCDTIPRSALYRKIAFDYFAIIKNLKKLKSDNSNNVTIKFKLLDRTTGNTLYSSNAFPLPLDSVKRTYSGNLMVPLNGLNLLYDLSLLIELNGIKEVYLNQTENINLINTYLSGIQTLGKRNETNVNLDQALEYGLEQNFPNPFNPATTIKFVIPKSSIVTLKIYDILGREVKELLNEFRPEGSYELIFDGRGLPSGVYFYQIQSANFIQTRKMVLIR
jgi:hypothetical protein